MISLTITATLSRNTSACSDASTPSTASRVVKLRPSAIVVSPSSDCGNRPTIMSAAVAGTTSSPRRELHHYYRLHRLRQAHREAPRPPRRPAGSREHHDPRLNSGTTRADDLRD